MKKRNIKYWVIGTLMVIGAFGLTLPFLFAKIRLASVTEKLIREGLPVTPREFADKYYKPVPEDQNAAETFDVACSLFRGEEPLSNQLIVIGMATAPVFDQKTAPVLLAPVEEFVSNNRDFFNAMDKINKFDRVHFNYEWEKGFGIELPRLNKMRNSIRGYAVKTELAITQNDPTQATELLKTMFHIDKLASQSPFMIGQLVFYACDAITIARLERCMNTLDFTPEQLKFFEKICSENEQYIIKQYPYLWKAELTFVLAIAESPDILEQAIGSAPYHSHPLLSKLPEKYRIAYYYYSGGLINDLTATVKAYRKFMDVPVDIYAKREPELEKIVNESRKHNNYLDLAGSVVYFYAKVMDSIARLRCAETACAVELFRLKYGTLPEKLEQLVPEFLPKVPIDPIDGKELRYVRGSFELQYEVPDPPVAPRKKQAPEKKEDMDESIFPMDEDSKELKYKTVIAKKTGFYVYSIGHDMIDDKSEELWERQRKDVIFLVVD